MFTQGWCITSPVVLYPPDVLLLGKTGKAIRPTNSNSGVSAVASVTLKKLVEPLKVVNMDDNEYILMKEIVLFNPG